MPDSRATAAVRDIVTRTSRPVVIDRAANTAPLIHACAAVLATDSDTALEVNGQPFEARVRGTILDIADGSGNAGSNGRPSSFPVSRGRPTSVGWSTGVAWRRIPVMLSMSSI